MKALTKSVFIRGKEFVLIQSESPKYHNQIENNNTFYGLIPYSELDEKGRMKRALNGFEMSIADSIGKTCEGMDENLQILEWQAANPGYAEIDLIEFVKQLLERKQSR